MPRHNQQALDFLGNVRSRVPGSPTPLLPRETLPKRLRALTALASTAPTLPPHQHRIPSSGETLPR